MRTNVTELMQRPMSPARMKAIMTIARKNNISFKEAQAKQAIAIAKSQLRKR